LYCSVLGLFCPLFFCKTLFSGGVFWEKSAFESESLWQVPTGHFEIEILPQKIAERATACTEKASSVQGKKRCFPATIFSRHLTDFWANDHPTQKLLFQKAAKDRKTSAETPANF
jgi:hypothetical protein